MRLDELKWRDASYAHVNTKIAKIADVGCVRVVKYKSGKYFINPQYGADWCGSRVVWEDLDPLTAQAVLFEICPTPCPVADPS